MTKKIWRDCVKDPSPLGKKVLCCNRGDFYVAQRFEEYYIPIPFSDSCFAKDLCKPETWTEIDFPEPFTGYIRMQIQGYGDELFTMDQVKIIDEKMYMEFVKLLIDDLERNPRPEKKK